MILKTKAIENFLTLASSPLAKRYTSEMEVQVNVAQDGGTKIKSGNSGFAFTDGVEIWKPFRIPFSAGTEAEYLDSGLTYNLQTHAEGIGMTGWNYVKRQSLWVGFDIDSITNHKAGLSTAELDEVLNVFLSLSYASVYKSTSGKGYHIYVDFSEPIITNNHNEHSAVARSLLELMCIDTQYDFKGKIDCLGGILWVWHRKTGNSNGLTLVKQGEPFDSVRLPSNWKDHVSVTSKRTKRVHLKDKKLEDLAIGLAEFPLQQSQKDLLSWMSKDSKYSWWYVQDLKMLVTHTIDLKRAFTELNMVGVFDTSSTGSSEQNCFCFPLSNGGWVVRRFGKSVKEHSSWLTDEHGWTKCFINCKPDLATACRFVGGQLDSKGFFHFLNGSLLNKVLEIVEIPYQIEADLALNKFKCSMKGNKVILQSSLPISQLPEGWVEGYECIEKVLFYKDSETDDNKMINLDHVCRPCISMGKEAGWLVRINDLWVEHPTPNVQKMVQSIFPDMSQKEIIVSLGKSLLAPWILVNEPFKEEYLGNRQWNHNSAQLAFIPERGACNSWFSILEHCGKELDNCLDEWCKTNDILSGRDYMLAWVASMFQRPYIHLPYLFLFSKEQNTGKSTFHSALRMLFKNERGYVRADRSLENTSGFNGELYNAICCVIEEVDLGMNKLAYARIKDYTTSPEISIRKLYHDPFPALNTTHWIQCSNNPCACPIEDHSDTRVVCLQVEPLIKAIPDYDFMATLREEAPAFLWEILKYPLPNPNSRLGLPSLTTPSKTEITSTNMNVLQRYVAERLYPCNGHAISFNDFYNRFYSWLVNINSKSVTFWNKNKVTTTWNHPTIIIDELKGEKTIFNASWAPEEPKKYKWIKTEYTIKKLTDDGKIL